jgi:hypothetical protein
MHKKHTLLFEQFTATFHPRTIVTWEKLISTWKKDHSQPNPYLEPTPCKSMAFILLFIELTAVIISHYLTGCAT